VPASYPDSDKRYSVLYVLDGNCLFTLTRQIAELLLIIPEITEMVIVGVGYPKDTYMQTLGIRGRDFTFRELTADEKSVIPYPFEETGGGPDFLKFVSRELIPLVETDYRIEPGSRGVIGYSGGAIFALHALLEQPELFSRIIAISPFIDPVLFEAEARCAERHSALPTNLFMAVEASETGEDATRIADVRRFVATVEGRNYDGFRATLRMYEGESHFSVCPHAITHSLKHMFGC